MHVDPDIINNEYYTLANALQKLQAGITDVPLEISRQLVPYGERQKVVYNYSNDEVEYLMSKSDPTMVREYDDIMQSFSREAEEIFRTSNIKRVEAFMKRMLQLGTSNHK